jgi:hypothetical protein
MPATVRPYIRNGLRQRQSLVESACDRGGIAENLFREEREHTRMTNVGAKSGSTIPARPPGHGFDWPLKFEMLCEIRDCECKYSGNCNAVYGGKGKKPCCYR